MKISFELSNTIINAVNKQLNEIENLFAKQLGLKQNKLERLSGYVSTLKSHISNQNHFPKTGEKNNENNENIDQSVKDEDIPTYEQQGEFSKQQPAKYVRIFEFFPCFSWLVCFWEE